MMDLTHKVPLATLLKRLDAQEFINLAPFSTLKVGGPARFFVKSSSVEDLAHLQLACQEFEVPLHILSGGSNTLFSDEGFAGVVVKLSQGFDYIEVAPDKLSLATGASTAFAKVTKTAVSLGWHCAVGWAGTPGLMGGALRMNAGTRRGEIKDAVLEIYGILDGKQIAYSINEIDFSYRKSTLPRHLIIYGAKLYCDKKNLSSPELLAAEVKAYQTKRKLTQPIINSAGSFFKNPPHTFAGKVIEECGLKGHSVGGAQVSPLHANFIVNTGCATAADIKNLATKVQTHVFNSVGVELELEIHTVGVFE